MEGNESPKEPMALCVHPISTKDVETRCEKMLCCVIVESSFFFTI
jgi:hypothetical protein